VSAFPSSAFVIERIVRVYGSFTGGFDTRDLEEAKRLPRMTLAVWKRRVAVMILPVILGGIDEALR
jgi:hypothetical protein